MTEQPTLEGHAIREANARKDHLSVVGEIPADAPSYAQLAGEVEVLTHQLEELTRKYHGVLGQLGRMRADAAHKAEHHKLWGVATQVFNEWRYATGHMKSHWTADRFETCLPALEEYGYGACRYAVWGLAANCFSRQITPGYEKRYDEFWRAFGPSAGKPCADHFESWVNAGKAMFGDWLDLGRPLNV